MQITQLINEKGNAVKNQIIINNQTSVTFQSYDSKIATYYFNDGMLVLYGDTWDYSDTTRKYFKTFINKFTHYNYENKNQWIDLINQSEGKISVSIL